MGTLTAALRDAGAWALRDRSLRRAALRLAARRGRGLALLYHRVTPNGPSPSDVVPTVSIETFARHIDALRSVGEIVPLDRLGGGATGDRPRFALTFDDDEPAHAAHALPVLTAAGAPATFFLGGRALHGLGAVWWVRLEHAIATRGLAAVCDALGVRAAAAWELAERCEGTDRVALIEQTFGAPGGAVLDADGIRRLAAAGMTVGFHTVGHPVLPLLDDAALARALGDGRERLADAAGRPIELLAYPHGRADDRVARHARAAGFRRAYATGNRPIGPGNDPFFLGRAEPGPREPGALLAWVALRLNAPVAAPPAASSPGGGAAPARG